MSSWTDLFLAVLRLNNKVIFNPTKHKTWVSIWHENEAIGWKRMIGKVCCATIGNYRLFINNPPDIDFYNDGILCQSIEQRWRHSFRFFNNNFQRNMLLQPKLIKTVYFLGSWFNMIEKYR
jgi:hypothetical protein